MMWKDPSKQGKQAKLNMQRSCKEAVRMALLRQFDPGRYQEEVDEKANRGGKPTTTKLEQPMRTNNNNTT